MNNEQKHTYCHSSAKKKKNMKNLIAFVFLTTTFVNVASSPILESKIDPISWCFWFLKRRFPWPPATTMAPVTTTRLMPTIQTTSMTTAATTSTSMLTSTRSVTPTSFAGSGDSSTTVGGNVESTSIQSSMTTAATTSTSMLTSTSETRPVSPTSFAESGDSSTTVGGNVESTTIQSSITTAATTSTPMLTSTSSSSSTGGETNRDENVQDNEINPTDPENVTEPPQASTSDDSISTPEDEAGDEI